MSQQTQDRRWEVDLEVDDFGNVLHRAFEDELQHELAKSGAVLQTIGGALQVYVIRQQDPNTGLWFPTKAVFKWQSFVPGVRAPQPAATPAPEPDVALEPEAQLGTYPELDDEEPAGDEEIEDGQVFEKRGEQRVATSAAETQELLRSGWTPVAVD